MAGFRNGRKRDKLFLLPRATNHFTPQNIMNKQVSPRLIFCLILVCLSPLVARESDNNRILKNTVPAQPSGEISDNPPVFTGTDLDRLVRKAAARKQLTYGDDGKFRSRKSSIMRRMASVTQGQHYDVDANRMLSGLSLIAGLYRESEHTDCAGFSIPAWRCDRSGVKSIAA
jgi:hypothetical protein